MDIDAGSCLNSLRMIGGPQFDAVGGDGKLIIAHYMFFRSQLFFLINQIRIVTIINYCNCNCDYLIMLASLNRFSQYLVSRQKTLIKRRKIAVKKRPISKKKLKEQVKIMNYSLEYKALQIQRQLDKRKYANEHIDQVMDQLFYPDIAFTNEESLDISLKLKKQQIDLDLNHINYLQGEQEDGMGNRDELESDSMIIEEINQQIRNTILPEDILKVYIEYSEELGAENFDIINYEMLFEQLGSYFTGRNKIMNQVMRDWDFKMKKMKKKDYKFKIKPCPYTFHDRQDIYRYGPWDKAIEGFASSITANHNCEKFIKQMRIAAEISYSLRNIPSQIYQAITKKCIELVPDHQLSLSNKVLILFIFNLQKKQYYPEHKSINNADQSAQMESSIHAICNKICQDIINNEECSFEQLEIVMKSLELKFAKVQQEEFELTKNIIKSTLSTLKVEKIIDYFSSYLKSSMMPDQQFIELLKFDIYRKLPHIDSLYHLIKCLSVIRVGKFLTNPETKFKVDVNAKDLFIRCAQILSSKYCGTGLIPHNKIRLIIWYYFTNKVRENHLLQLMANELVKNKEIFPLQELTESIFQINLLGYRSPVLSQVLFSQFLLRYESTKKRYQDKQQYLLPNQQQDKKIQEKQSPRKIISKQQKKLEEMLVIMLWMLISTTKQTNQLGDRQERAAFKVKVDSLLKLYPLRISSHHPMIIEMCKNIFDMVKDAKIFWPIKYKSYSLKEMEGLIDQKTDGYRKYYNANTDPVTETMLVEASESQNFIYNYNCDDNAYTPESWSSVSQYSISVYEEWVRDNINKPEVYTKNYFNRQKNASLKLVDMRRKLSMRNLKAQKKEDKEKSKNTIKYYELD